MTTAGRGGCGAWDEVVAVGEVREEDWCRRIGAREREGVVGIGVVVSFELVGVVGLSCCVRPGMAWIMSNGCGAMTGAVAV